uniref:Uncharacterized protein n=1 Tax=uncultured gamma proteobacterium EB080_L93H08 TaxID=710973 RepID=E0Y2J0_9GAMM|nr:hypothetical protein [uncultured gamma proteobacterium EB080_L93H08]
MSPNKVEYASSLVGNLAILSISLAGYASPLIAKPTVLRLSCSLLKSLNNLAGDAKSSLERAITIGPLRLSERH